MRLAAIVFFFCAVRALALVLPTKRPQICNGHADLCERKYGNITFLGSHDSFAASPSPFSLARTQEVDLDAQLNLGVRMLQAQGRMNGNELHFCHTTCGLFDGGTVEIYLKKVKSFLDQHPNDVLTLIFTNPEHHSVSHVWKPIFDKAGITEMAYVPPHAVMTREDWPTLGEMIKTGKRVIVFLDKGANRRAVDFILPQFRMLWEDVFDPTEIDFPCKVDRTAGPLTPSQQLNLINHNLNIQILPVGRGILFPARLHSPMTNGVNSILEHAAHCAKFVGDRAPNFVMLDYVNVGQGVEAVARLNSLTS